MHRRNLSFAVFVSLLLVLGLVAGGCSWLKNMTIPDTPAGKYLAAREMFNGSIQTYLEYYELQPAETQAAWKANIDPLADAGFVALDGWKLALVSGDPTFDWVAEFLVVKRQLINLFAQYFIKTDLK